MNQRRNFMKLFPALAAVPAFASGFNEPEQWDGGDSLLGSWNSVHTLPFPPGSFREFLSFAEGGVIHETNSFLYTTSNLDFSAFGLPASINASDGAGTWTAARNGKFDATFRKLMFDGAKVNFADLLVTGTLKVKNGTLHADWHIQVVDATSGAVLTDFGPGTSVGSRIG